MIRVRPSAPVRVIDPTFKDGSTVIDRGWPLVKSSAIHSDAEPFQNFCDVCTRPRDASSGIKDASLVVRGFPTEKIGEPTLELPNGRRGQQATASRWRVYVREKSYRGSKDRHPFLLSADTTKV